MPEDIRSIHSSGAPAALGPYSQGIVAPAGDYIYTAGQVGLDPATGEFVSSETLPQFRRAMENLRAVLEEAGTSFQRVVKVNLYFVDFADYAAVNEAYAEYFSEPFPARAAIQAAALPKGARVEVDLVARVG